MTRLILASQSKARNEMLRKVGLDFESIPADLDEDSIMAKLTADNAPFHEIATTLAEQKALAVARENPDALVIGSDTIMVFGGKVHSKSETPEAAIDTLRAMSGQSHDLISGVAVAKGDEILWSHHDIATLTMHNVSEDFLAHYKSIAGAALTTSVGGYWIEDAGAFLFQKIEGDLTTIFGMPLMPLLECLDNA